MPKYKKKGHVLYNLQIPEALDKQFRDHFYRKRGDLTEHIIEAMELLIELKHNGKVKQ